MRSSKPPTARTGIEKARQELPDLILCDVNMEKVDGYLTLTSLRNEAPTAAIPFILMTGLADNAGMRHGMELGADDYLPKPFTTDALYAAVDARLKKAQTVRDEAERKLASLRDNISLMLPHEMRTPLNGILAYGEILATSTPPRSSRPRLPKWARTFTSPASGCERLIENFSIYAQLELIAADPKNVNALRIGPARNMPRALIKQLRASAGGAGGPLAGPDPGCCPTCPCRCPRSTSARSWTSWLQNAFKFSEAGSPVRVTLDEGLNSRVLSISDQRLRLFARNKSRRIGAYMQFDRKMQDQQGLGLGLTISQAAGRVARRRAVHRGPKRAPAPP